MGNILPMLVEGGNRRGVSCRRLTGRLCPRFGKSHINDVLFFEGAVCRSCRLWCRGAKAWCCGGLGCMAAAVRSPVVADEISDT